MKYLIILFVLAFFVGLIYLRLRPYIKLARRMFGIARAGRSMSQNEPAQPLHTETGRESMLVRCDGCHTWIPASRAVKLRSSRATYCSHSCLETSTVTSHKRKTAS